MDEHTYLLKYFNYPIDKGEIIIPNINNEAVVSIEIISKYFNCKNYKFAYTCTNCYKLEKLGDTLNGLVIEVYKANIHQTSKLSWNLYKK